MTHLIEVRFQQGGKEYTYDAGESAPQAGEYVIVETPKGIDLAEVTKNAREVETEEGEQPWSRMVRTATPQDIQRATDNRAREQEAYRVCNQKIAEHKLEMKLVSVEVLFDNSKMLFYFTANGRVDFRGLVKDLASVFRTRIELRQIGVRDEARMLGGLGSCGRPICCGTFLNDFQPVSIKMAKEQNLSLNPTKISGVCGRLMCCLKYEQDQYEQTRKRMPRVGREVETPDGIGVVTDLNIVKETVFVRIPSGDATEIKEYPLEQTSRPGAERKSPAEDQEAPAEATEAAETEMPEDEAVTAEFFQEAETVIIDGEAAQNGPEDSEADKPPVRKPRPRRNGEENRPAGSRRFGPREDGAAGENEAERGPRKGKGLRPRRNEKSEKSEKSGAPNGEKNGGRPAGRTGEGNPEKNERSKGPREQKFGQPVRRENPNRTAPVNQAQSAPAEKSAPAKAENTNPAKAEPAKKRTSWADAVEQALKATDA